MTDAASNGYEVALLDWLGCAARGRQEEAAEAARGVEDRLVFAATAGHVLDFDDTYLPGLAHLSAPVAPAALVLAAELEKTTGDALAAYIRGFEAMGALARASHPALYDRGWHPTAVCGAAGAAVAASHLLDAPVEAALAIALLQGGGLRAAFGSHGKSLQVGLAAASGVQAARLARAGARVPLETAARGWEQATGGTFARPQEGQDRAIDENWIKAWPCCLQTHGAIEAAASVRDDHANDRRPDRHRPPGLAASRRRRPRARRRPPGQVLDPVPDRLHAPPRTPGGRELQRRRRRRDPARTGNRDQDRPDAARVRVCPERTGRSRDSACQSRPRLARPSNGRHRRSEPSSKACSAQSRRPRSTKTSPPNGSSSASASNPAFATGADGG